MRSRRTRTTLATIWLALSLALSACGGPQTPSAKPTPKLASDAGAPSIVDAGPELESLEALATRGALEAPLMREAQRVADATKPYEMKLDRDTCVRAIFASGQPARAWIEDDAKMPRGDVAPASTSSLVPPKGPACARKGETLRLVIDGAPSARAVIWQAP